MNNLYEEMNIFLANEIVLGMKIHNIHWFLKGTSFYTIHEKMDEFYAQSQARVDEVAERLLSIGAKPIGNLETVLKTATLKELDTDLKTAEEGFTTLVVDFEVMTKAALRLIGLADEVNDYATADYFTTITAQLQKDLWMMNAFRK